MGRSEEEGHLYSDYSMLLVIVTKEYLLTSSEKDDYTATENTGVFLTFQNRKK